MFYFHYFGPPFTFSRFILIVLCMCMCEHLYVDIWLHTPTEGRTGVKSDCQSPDLSAGNRTWALGIKPESSASAVFLIHKCWTYLHPLPSSLNLVFSLFLVLFSMFLTEIFTCIVSTHYYHCTEMICPTQETDVVTYMIMNFSRNTSLR